MIPLPLLLLFACGTPEAPPAADPTPATTPAPPPAAAAPRAAVVYSVRNIDQLQPTPASRTGKASRTLTDTPQLQATLSRLGTIVDQYGGDPENPWAIGHGLVARGEGWKLTNGEDAIDWLFAHYAEEVTFGEHTLVRFPAERGGLRIEPHAELMLKMLTEVDVSPERVVTVGGHPHPLADLYRGALMARYLDPFSNHSSFESTDDIAWALQGFAAWSEPGLVWVSSEGTAMSLKDFALFGGAVLKQETAPIAEAMAVGATFERQGQGIFRYTCGGAHLLQSVGYAVSRGIGGEKLAALFSEQIALSFYRLPRELAIYDAASKRYPDQADRLLVQRLKFTGHFVESMYKFAALGLFEPDDDQQVLLDGAALQIALTVEALGSQGVFDRLPQLKDTDEQLYLDVIGDSAHALHGLRLGLGEDTVRY